MSAPEMIEQMSAEGRQLFTEAAQTLGIDIAPHLDAFSTFQDLLIRTGRTTNLTSLLGERDIVLKHFVDSLTCLHSGWFDGPLRVLDIGTGAGFPGLPLAIVRPNLNFDLLDSTRRKIEFVDSVIRALELPNARGVLGRAEWLGRQPEARAGYDRVVTRAVSALPVLAELALPLLKEGGMLIAQKGPITEDELAAGRRALALLGGQLENVQALALPVLNDPRTLVCIRKIRPTPNKYPRLDGVPAKSPLS
jgi:16S rRNA (guanine527-N7)-methyltransferase